jgi:hypothetical protein
MHVETIDTLSLKNLKLLQKENLLNDFYLAGGTAVALHLGHRISYDLDFFNPKTFDGLLLKRIISNLGNYKDTFSNENNMIGIFNGTRLSFIYYKSEMTGEFLNFAGIKIAAIEDLIAMKIEAISQRGKKRDFIDLFAMMKNSAMTLSDVMSLYRKKYKGFNINEIHVLKSFIFFADAEKDQMPELKLPIQWTEVKSFFNSQKIYISKLLDDKTNDPDF